MHPDEQRLCFKLMPQGHYVLILMALLFFGTLLEPPLEIVFRTCILCIIFILIIIHPLRSDGLLEGPL